MFKARLDRVADRLEGVRLRGLPAILSRPAVRRGFLIIGVLAVVVAAIALVAGSTKMVIGGLVLRNSSVVRPLVIAIAAFALAQAWRHALTWAPFALLLLLPLSAARETLLLASRPAHPLRALHDCARPLVEAGRVRGGAYAVSRDSVPHTYAFYALPLGTWDATTAFDPAVHGPALDDPAQPRALVLSGVPSATWRCSGCARANPFRPPSVPIRTDRAPAGPAGRLRQRRRPRRRAIGRRLQSGS